MRYILLLSALILGFSACLPVGEASAQDLKRQYKHAKMLFDNKDYALAMEAFKPLIVYDKDNPSPEYSSFFYGVAAYELN